MDAIKRCKLKGCTKASRSQSGSKPFTQQKDYCNPHYQKWLKYDDPHVQLRLAGVIGCKVPGCEKPHNSKWFCVYHYKLSRRNGKPENVYEMGHIGCRVKWCRDPHHAHGYCGTHNKRWLRNGDPLALKRGWKGAKNKKRKKAVIIGSNT